MRRGKGEGGRGKGPALALAAPGCILAAASALALVMAAWGRHPLWPQQQLNLSEAAALRDRAEVVRLVERGADPNVRNEIRAGLLFDHPSRLSPLEAAVESGDGNMIHTLLAAGVSLDAETWARLRCHTDRREIIAALDAHVPAGADPRCSGTP